MSKFKKDSIEFKMFADFYKLVEKYYEVQDSKEYFDELANDFSVFQRGYNFHPLAVALTKGFAIEFVDGQYKQIQRLKKEMENSNLEVKSEKEGKDD